MQRDPRYDVLFEPVRIGPKTARNRFYQVPHCNGMGYRHPAGLAEMRGVKAEGGWAVVSTEEVEIHPTADLSPYQEGRLWDDSDIPYHRLTVEKIQAHGSLAAIELVHGSHHANNLYSREVPLSVTCRPVDLPVPVHSRAMDLADIRAYRRWHRDAALRAKRCGYDLIYVYCSHDMTLHSHFLSRRNNDRIDDYGGSLENRLRLLKEVLQDTLEAVGDTCAVPLRFAVDELLGADGLSCDAEGRDAVEMLAEMPDLWDVNLSGWANDSQTSRFAEAGFQDAYIAFVKQVTSKPVVGVGRHTSPDAMVSLIKRGVVDMIGAARPSIADPFLPRKIEEGRIDDIRECIGCNVCVTGDNLCVPMRCTQNPTVGEEWRRGWHPERVPAKTAGGPVLIVGAGPAGLEAARVLGERGHDVMLAEASTELGGRVAHECRLPGLAEWGRVRDYRAYRISQLPTVEVYFDSAMGAAEILETGAAHVAIATGATWRRDGMGRENRAPIPGSDGDTVFTPDDIMAGALPTGAVVIYDDDHYYMGGVLAEKLRQAGAVVTLLTPANTASAFTENSLEQVRIQSRLLEMDVAIETGQSLQSIGAGAVETACVYTGRERHHAADAIVLVTAMVPNDALWTALAADKARWADAGLLSATRIGDALAPGIIASAVWSGHRYGRALGSAPQDGVPFRREAISLSYTPIG